MAPHLTRSEVAAFLGARLSRPELIALMTRNPNAVAELIQNGVHNGDVVGRISLPGMARAGDAMPGEPILTAPVCWHNLQYCYSLKILMLCVLCSVWSSTCRCAMPSDPAVDF